MASDAQNHRRDQHSDIVASLLKCKTFGELEKVTGAHSAVFRGFVFPIDSTKSAGKKGPKSADHVVACRQAAQAWADKHNPSQDASPDTGSNLETNIAEVLRCLAE